MMWRALAFAGVFLCCTTPMEAQKVFSSFQELWAYAEKSSITLQTGSIKMLQAQKSRLAAIAGIPDPVWNNSLNFTNNTRLPVNLFPAEAFGGQAGEYREVQTGLQYNTTVSSSLDIKLVNLEGWQNVKLAKLNIDITNADNQLNLKNLLENLASTYFNVIQLQAQLKSTQQSLLAADTLLQISENKYQQGIARQQDVNDSRVNQMNLQENARQIELLIQKQYLVLKSLCDISEQEQIVISEKPGRPIQVVRPAIEPASLMLRSSFLKEQSALASLNRANYAFAPTLAFVANNSYNQYNPDFTLFGGKWIHSQYVGLRLNFNLPNANSIANRSKAKYDHLLALKNTQQAGIQSASERLQLANAWEQAISQHATNARVLALQRDTYQKNKNLYKEGIQSLDRTLTSFTAMVNAEYNLITSEVSTALAQAKIDIHNKFN